MDDLISRRAAIDALQEEIDKGIPPFDDVIASIRCGVRLARNIIEDLPSAQPEPHEGEWIDKGIFNNGLGISWHCWECSKCHSQKTSTSNYCPNCGARMKGAKDGNK